MVSGLNGVSLFTHLNKDIRDGLKLRGLCYPICVLCSGHVCDYCDVWSICQIYIDPKKYLDTYATLQNDCIRFNQNIKLRPFFKSKDKTFLIKNLRK